ncbi:hypothetical protein Tfont_02664 [Tepidimonas fonticaldi]|uniref:Uncharacterized protein n=2 Tax=Tepidimonas fonticaldi TaxID=1101373 RepID=A0A554XEY1_9BURK|nr:hypothetical protein Tfont_02664 [Tepidimonas fonticaldi]
MVGMALCPAFPRPAIARLPWAAVALLTALLASACSPALDWRTVRQEATPLTAVLPCKPERATRDVPLRGPQQPLVTLHMLSCEAAGHTFAVAAVRLPDAWPAGEGPAGWIDDWQRASWATLQLQPGPDGVPPGWAAVPCVTRGATVQRCWRGPGRTPAGAPVQAELHWASDGRWLAQVALYGPGLSPDAHETYFGGLALRGSGG